MVLPGDSPYTNHTPSVSPYTSHHHSTYTRQCHTPAQSTLHAHTGSTLHLCLATQRMPTVPPPPPPHEYTTCKCLCRPLSQFSGTGTGKLQSLGTVEGGERIEKHAGKPRGVCHRHRYGEQSYSTAGGKLNAGTVRTWHHRNDWDWQGSLVSQASGYLTSRERKSLRHGNGKIHVTGMG